MVKPVCGRLNVGCAGSGPGVMAPPLCLVLVLVLFPWYSGLCLCLVLVRAKPLALSLYKGEAIVRVYGACAWYSPFVSGGTG